MATRVLCADIYRADAGIEEGLFLGCVSDELAL